MDRSATSRPPSDTFGTGIAITSPSHKSLPPSLPSLGLPTPSSLPREYGMPGVDTEMEDQDLMGGGSGSASEGTEGDVGGYSDTAFVMEMEGQESGGSASGRRGSQDVDERRGSTRTTNVMATHVSPRLVPRASFSSNTLIHRPFRARYMDDDELPTTVTAVHAATASPPSYKRSFSQVSPSNGSTPPYAPSHHPFTYDDNVYASPFTEDTSSAPRPSSAARPTFDSQRASGASRSPTRFLRDMDSTLRRRSPAVSRTASRASRRSLGAGEGEGGSHYEDGEDRSKRRRPSCDSRTTAAGEESDDATAISSTTFAPALGRYPSRPSPVDPVLTPSFTIDRTRTVAVPFNPRDTPSNRPSRLSRLPSFGSNSALRATMLNTITPTPHLPPREPPQQQAAVSSSPPTHRRRLSSLTAFASFRRSSTSQLADPVLTPESATPRLEPRAPSDVDRNSMHPWLDGYQTSHNSRAQEVIARTAQALASADESIERTTRMLERFPSVPLDDPRDVDFLPTLPSIRHLPSPERSNEVPPVIGFALGPRRHPSPPTTTPRGPIQSPSPPSSDDNSSLGTSASRALHFLTSLRSRRPRLSRNATAVTPPEESPDPTLQRPDRESAWLLPPHEAIWDDATEGRRAEEFTDRLLARRAAAAWGSETRASIRRLDPADSGNASRDSLMDPRWGDVVDRPDPTAAWSSFNNLAIPPTASTRRPPSSDSTRTPSNGSASASIIPALHTSGRTETHPSARQSSPSPRSRRQISRRPWRSTVEDEDDDMDLGDDWREDLGTGHGRLRSASDLSLQRAAFSPRINVGARDFGGVGTTTRSGPNELTTTGTPTAPAARRSAFRLPRIAPSLANRRPSIFDDLSDEAPDPANRRVIFPTSAGTGLFSSRPRPPAPIDTATSELEDNASRYHPSFGFEATRYPRPSSRPSSGLSPRITTTNTTTTPSPPRFLRRVSIIDAFAGLDTQDAQTLRHRRTASQESTDTDRLQQRQVRSERLASLRHERDAMRTLIDSMDEPDELPIARAGGGRRRGLSDFLRGIGGGARIASLFEDDFAFIMGGRGNAVALDPRNYLDDEEFDPSYESLLRLSERLGDVKPKGVDPSKLSELRKFQYIHWPFPTRSDSTCIPRVASTSAVRMEEEVPLFARKGVEKEERCAVCLMDYEDSDEIILTTCDHGFHTDCLSAWLKEHGSCPVCRRDHA